MTFESADTRVIWIQSCLTCFSVVSAAFCSSAHRNGSSCLGSSEASSSSCWRCCSYLDCSRIPASLSSGEVNNAQNSLSHSLTHTHTHTHTNTHEHTQPEIEAESVIKFNGIAVLCVEADELDSPCVAFGSDDKLQRMTKTPHETLRWLLSLFGFLLVCCTHLLSLTLAYLCM